MFKLFFAPRLAKIHYKETKNKSERKIIEEIYDFYYKQGNVIEKELKKAMMDRKLPILNGKEQSSFIINELNEEIVKYGNEKNYPEELIVLFLQ